MVVNASGEIGGGFSYEEGLNALLEHSPVLLFASDRRARITFARGHGLERLGLRPDNIVGQSVFDVFRNSPTMLAAAERALGGERFTEVVELWGAYYEAHYVPLFGPDLRPRCVISFAVDITARRHAAEAQRRRDLQLAEAERVAHFGIWHWNLSTDEFVCSAELFRILGVAPIAGPTRRSVVVDRVHPEDRERVRDEVERALRTRGPFHFDVRVLRSDGMVRNLLASGELVSDELAHERLVGIALDVTDRKLDEQELRRSLSLLRATLESTADGILVVDRHGGIVTYNQKFTEQWGIPDEIARTQDDRLAIDFATTQLKDPQGFLAKVRSLYDQPDVESSDTFEFKDGRVFERYSKAQRLSGVSVGRVWSFRDVTGQRRAEAERDRLLVEEQTLRVRAEEEERRSTFLADASRLLASLDYEGALGGVARLCVPRLGDWCAIDVVTDKNKVRRIASARAESMDPSLAQAIERLGPCQDLSSARSLGPDVGRIRAMGVRSCLARPLYVPGRTLGVLVLVSTDEERYGLREVLLAENLAERIALAVDNAQLYRQSQEALRLRDDFISVASHELNTPLTSLLLGLQLLLSNGVGAKALTPEEQHNVLTRAERQTRQLRTLVSQLLDASRVRDRGLTLELVDMDLAELTRGALELMSTELERSGCQVILRAETPVIGHWDRLRLEQVACNLLSNAARFGPGKPIEITVESYGRNAVLRVSDHGIGISPERVRQIFERFDRAVSATHYGGLGLGLYLSRAIVEALGGTLRVQSEPGQGATFFVELPKRRS